jgi:hypothetical protein
VRRRNVSSLYLIYDIASAGPWIVGIDSDNVQQITVIVATTISKLFENEQILPTNIQFDEAPTIQRPQTSTQCRKSNESAFASLFV